MFNITETEVARAIQNRKGYVYDFGGRRFYLVRACASDGCGFDFCAGLNRSCLNILEQKVTGILATAEEFSDLAIIDTRLVTAGTILILQENDEVVFNQSLSEDCLVAKFEGPITTRLKLIPDRLYVIGTSMQNANGLLVQAISSSHARDVFGRLHDLRCSLTARLLVEGTLDRKLGPGTGRLGRPLQQPNFDPERGTILVDPNIDFADPLPHEVRGLTEGEQREIVEKGLAGTSTSILLTGEQGYTDTEMVGFERRLLDGTFLIDSFGAALVESSVNTEIPSLTFQDILDAIDEFEAAKAVFGLPPASTPARPSNIDDDAYAVTLVNHADSQVEGMRRKIVFTSDAAVNGDIRAGLLNPTAEFGGMRVKVGNTREAVGNAARTVGARTEDLLGLVRQNRLDSDTMIRAHRVWFRLEAYQQRMRDLDPVFRTDRSALDSLSDVAVSEVGAKIGAATVELYLALKALGTETNFGRTTTESTERRRLYQSLNAHPAILNIIAGSMAELMQFDAIDIPQSTGSEDSSPFVLVDQVFGVPPQQLDELEQGFADSLGPDGFDPAIGVIPADGQQELESRLASLFGAQPISGISTDSLENAADRAALYEGGRINSPEDFV